MSNSMGIFKRLTLAGAMVASMIGGATEVKAQPQYVGINYAWLGSYGHSFGTGGINGQAAAYSSQTVQAAFDDMKAHNLNVVRIFIFDGLEGIYSNGQMVTPSQSYLNNLSDFVTRANADGLMVYITLFNTWDFVSGTPPYSQEIFNPHTALDSSVTYNSIIPAVVHALSGKNVMYDVLNESNNLAQYYSNGWQNLEGWSTVNGWIGRLKSAIRVAGSSALVTSSINNFDVIQYNTGLDTAQLDFYDFHSYNNAGSIPLTSTTMGDGKPVWTGEFGPSTNWANTSNASALVDSFINTSKSVGDTGIMAWSYDTEDPFSMVGTAEFNELGTDAGALGIGGVGSTLYDFENSTDGWIGTNVAGGPWSVNEWAATGSDSLKADVNLTGAGIYSLSNQEAANYSGLTKLTACVRHATWGTYSGGMTAKLYVQTGSGWTWYDGGAVSIGSSTSGTTLTLYLNSVGDLGEVDAVGVQFVAGSGDSGASSIYVDDVTLQ